MGCSAGSCCIMERVVVVGAGLSLKSSLSTHINPRPGFYGLVTAKTYRQVTGAYRHGTPEDHELYADEVPACFTTPRSHAPKSGLLIIDSASDLGGSWASERLYPNLLSQNSYGLYEYSDLPLAAAVPTNSADEAAQFIPGWKINRYLHIWSEKWALKKHIRLNWKVGTYTVSHISPTHCLRSRPSADCPPRNGHWTSPLREAPDPSPFSAINWSLRQA